jgi:hypothetical protein
MTRYTRNGFLGLMIASLAACTGSVGGGQSPGVGGSQGPQGTGGSNTTGNAGAGPVGNAGSTGTGGTGAGGAAGAPIVISPCAPGIPASSQVPRLTRTQYANVINELLGVTPAADVMTLIPNDSSGSMTKTGWDGYMSAGEKVAAQVLANATSKAKFINCDAAQATCLSDTIKAFGRKAFRRPLTEAEVTSFMRFNSLPQTHTAADVTEAILYAFLVSPTFIMVPELAETPEGSAFKLNHFEVAAKLSLLLWNSLPDPMLTAAADNSQLGTAEQVAMQAKRMLADPKATGVAKTFHGLYADIQTGSHWLVGNEHDTAKYPSFKPGSYNAAIAELDAFFADIVTGGGTFKDLFTSTTGFVTSDTAAIYGLTGSFTTTPMKTALDAAKRPGFLTRVAFLSTFSRFDATSPILRGAFITGRVLNVPTGTPNPAVRDLPFPTTGVTTNRQAVEQLTAAAACADCHAGKVNPPGFVLERYDAIGAWQDTDRLGGAINSTADITFDGTTFRSISTPAELMTGIAASPNAQQFYAAVWVNFAAGRPSTLNDACVVEQLTTNLANPTYSIASMMADFAKSDSFRLRTLGN